MNMPFSPLQACLPQEFMQRGLEDLYTFLNEAGLDLDQIVSGRISRMSPNQDFVFLDAGCGAGRTPEEFARQMGLKVHLEGFKQRIRTIGLDKNPIPSSLFKSWSTQFYRGDVVTMNPLNRSSVDLGVSIRVLQYLEDHLKALSSGWRILKPGGIMVWDANYAALTNPSLEEILAQTPRGRQIFEVRRVSETRAVIICCKQTDVEFNGFLGYKRVRTESPFPNDPIPYRRFLTESHYEAI